MILIWLKLDYFPIYLTFPIVMLTLNVNIGVYMHKHKTGIFDLHF